MNAHAVPAASGVVARTRAAVAVLAAVAVAVADEADEADAEAGARGPELPLAFVLARVWAPALAR
eukprot:353188-Chlamydomonas_euryale.AAC.8